MMCPSRIAVYMLSIYVSDGTHLICPAYCWSPFVQSKEHASQWGDFVTCSTRHIRIEVVLASSVIM